MFGRQRSPEHPGDHTHGRGRPCPGPRRGSREAPGRIDAASKLLAGRPDLAVRSTLLEGDPATVILDQARRENADLIVIASHGYGPVKKIALGWVSQAVATQADCSVEIVRCPHTDA